MNDNFYRQLIEESPTGYAYHKIICDKDGIPYDYEFIEVNASFEKLTGLKGSDIIGKRVTKVLPDIKNNEFDWIHFYGEVAINGGKKELEQFSESLKHVYKIYIYSPEKYYFITYFTDITKQISQLSEMERLIGISEEFLQINEEKIDYKKITDEFLKICGAKYAFFNLFDEDGKSFTTMALSLEKGTAKIISHILGFEIEGNKWEYKEAMSEKIKDETITHFKSLREFADNVLPTSTLLLLEKTCNMGEIIVVTISKNNILLGHFILCMKKGESFDKSALAEIYTRQLGMVISRKKKDEEIYYLSYHDQLTGLYNRRFYEEELKRLDTARNLPMTIVMGDVNGLKLINDSFGHVIGDELIKKAAEVTGRGCRSDDIVARLGGDEFVIILPKTDSFETEQIIKRITKLALSEKIGFIDISISFGYQTKNNEKEKTEEILKNAEDDMYKKKLFESPNMRVKTISAIINTLDEKNKSEEQHSYRVSELCKSMGEALGLLEDEIEELRLAGLFHDIGKIAINENILNKPGKLTEDEWKEIKRHPEIGYRILKTVNDMCDMANYVLYHHERWNGEGYPKGLKGDEIPFVSRIVTIANAYDVMISKRSYKKTMQKEVAIEELQKNVGIQFDPELVSVFIEKVLG
ncbi:MAG TPA: HD domain-containing phosphohydrolase [Clostridium sp.]